MNMNAPGKDLNVKVGETLRQAGKRAADAMRALDAGKAVASYFGISFEQVGQMLAAFTPKRWELIAALREGGPMTVAELARRLGRNYENVHAEVQLLIEWLAAKRDDDGRVNVPWSEIVVVMKVLQRAGA